MRTVIGGLMNLMGAIALGLSWKTYDWEVMIPAIIVCIIGITLMSYKPKRTRRYF